MNIVINLDKPENISSQQAVTRVKRLFSAKKAGHAGTLDPLATGILIVCLDEATKITRFLADLNKEYIVRLKLGERTDTYDSTGRVIDRGDFHFIKEADICKVLSTFIGPIKQTPPMYSAIKVGGQPLYKLARKGFTVERQERDIIVNAMDLLSFDPPYVDLKISCSKGTYIRTICDDIGKSLGSGAHMVSLTRTRVGAFRIEDSVSIEGLINNKDMGCSIDSAIMHLKEIILDEESYAKAKNGVSIICPAICLSTPLLTGDGKVPENSSINQYIRLKSPQHVLFGIGKIDNNRIKIERLLN